jgi:hypothetical protein
VAVGLKTRRQPIVSKEDSSPIKLNYIVFRIDRI